ncbi:exodeoxyribonuclease VII small subunit [Aeromicrobium sp. CF3.5]|uniref:exodeoxyribonuclease VII small subunit n=1 Tax=Aeromicrobium sp. CF3.5 TaxID=3373078 RepID=UPI003EE4A235
MTESDSTDLPYEQARDELISVVQKLETGGTTLEQSLTLWERGEELAAMCQRRLDGVRARLDRSDSTHSDRDEM